MILIALCKKVTQELLIFHFYYVCMHSFILCIELLLEKVSRNIRYLTKKNMHIYVYIIYVLYVYCVFLCIYIHLSQSVFGQFRVCGKYIVLIYMYIYIYICKLFILIRSFVLNFQVELCFWWGVRALPSAMSLFDVLRISLEMLCAYKMLCSSMFY